MTRSRSLHLINNKRKKFVSMAKETLAILKEGSYISCRDHKHDISNHIENSKNNTKYYKPDFDYKSYYEIKETNQEIHEPTLEVINETTFSAIRRLIVYQEKRNVVALNFANPVNPGGAWLEGSQAQEETLTRASTLYSSIKAQTCYYNNNRKLDHTYATDGIIYSPNVLFFRADNDQLLEHPFPCSIITCPAPNLRDVNYEELDEDFVSDLIKRRIEKIIKVAIDNNHKNIILGAWGAGAFCNDPAIIARHFSDTLKSLPLFEHIVFPVFDKDPQEKLYKTFWNIIR